MQRLYVSCVALWLCLLLVACTVSKLVLALDAVQVANEAALVAIPIAVGNGVLTSSDGAQAMLIVEACSTATSAAITEAESTDTAAVMDSKIVADYASVLKAIPGLSPSAQTIISGIVQAVEAVLSQLNPPASVQLTIKLSRTDRSNLQGIHARAVKSADLARGWLLTLPGTTTAK